MFSSPAESCPEEGLSHSTFPAQNQSKCLLHNRAIAKKSSSRHFCAKVGLKPPHSTRWRDCRGTFDFAKRLECGAFTAAIGNKRRRVGSGVQGVKFFSPNSSPRLSGVGIGGSALRALASVSLLYFIFVRSKMG